MREFIDIFQKSHYSKFLTNFSAKRAIFEVWAGLGHSKSGLGWATQKPWPTGQISGQALARPGPSRQLALY